MRLDTFETHANHSTSEAPILVLGGTGKVGRRVVSRLQHAGAHVRIGSRSGTPAFDWNDQSTWAAALNGVRSVFIAYVPDLAVPGAEESIADFCTAAVDQGVEHLVLLSGRGEPEAQRCEAIVQNCGTAWTICRAGWFMQNLSEAFMYDMVIRGAIPLPGGSMTEPFIDCDDIADVAAAALLDPRHHGQLYELTGPELLSFGDLARILSAELNRDIRYIPITAGDFTAGLEELGLGDDYVWLLGYLFTEVFDGRNAAVGDGVQRALGRPPRRFVDYVRAAQAAGAWDDHTVTRDAVVEVQP